MAKPIIKRMECRIVITRHAREDLKVELGMYDPKTERYAPLGAHGPSNKVVDKAIMDLRAKMEEAGHEVTFCERSHA